MLFNSVMKSMENNEAVRELSYGGIGDFDQSVLIRKVVICLFISNVFSGA